MKQINSLEAHLGLKLIDRTSQIHIVDTPHFYDMSVFNRCAQSGDVLLTIECWQNVHPLLVTIPVEWDFTIPYGILYAKEPPEDVLRLIELVRTNMKKG